MTLSYEAVRARINDLGKIIDVPVYFLPTYAKTEDGARPHIEIDDDSYHYVAVERGQEILRWTTRDWDELLYWVFEHATATMAARWEAAHRIEGQDFRRRMFAKQLDLLGKLDEAWRERRRDHLQRIEAEYPYSDGGDSTKP